MKNKLIQHIIDNNAETELFNGVVCWWSDQDQNGLLLVGDCNHEVYFDKSVLSGEVTRGSKVEFYFNCSILDTACAKNVRVIKEDV